MLKSILKSSFPLIVAIVCTMVFASPLFSQWGPGHGKGPKAKEKIAMVKKMKLLEILDLDEKNSDKFLVKYSVWENKIQEQMELVKNSIDELENSLKNSESKDEISKKTSKVQQEQKSFSNLLFQAQEDIKSILNEVQFAKYVIFEHKFKEELQKMIMKRMKGKGQNMD